ncbi:MAG: hypothetical protein GY778_31040 [bacterium]|nr:hypothetical protein [bacterium]
MAITLQCPSLKCRSVLQVSERMRGRKVRCGQCGIAFVVPADKNQPTTPTTHASSAETPTKP